MSTQAKAPKHARTGKQQAATKAWAAAGRAAQRGRARTASQKAASLKWAAAGRAAQRAKRQHQPAAAHHPRQMQKPVLKLPGGALVATIGAGGKGGGLVQRGGRPHHHKKKAGKLKLPGGALVATIGAGASKSSALQNLAAHKKRSAAAKKGAKTRARNKKKRALVMPSGWVPPQVAPSFANDYAPVCTVAAIATHLWLMTGLEVSDTEVLAVNAAAGGCIEDVLEFISDRGLGSARLAAFWPLRWGPETLAGAVTGLRFAQGRHTAVSLGRGRVLSWASILPLRGEVEESWWLEWDVKEMAVVGGVAGDFSVPPLPVERVA